MLRFFVTLILLASALHAKVFVAVVETMASDEALSYEEKSFMTDKLRENANNVLGYLPDFSVMTNENIRTMLPEGKSVEDCEGQCLVETGKNINADYIAQARVVLFGNSLALTVELYETSSGKLMGNFTGRGDSAEDLLQVIDENAESLFMLISNGGSANYGFSGAEGFVGMSTGSSYNMRAEKKYIVSVFSEPSNALLSIDGKPQTNCSSTPCKLELSAGRHRFSFVKEMYADKDTMINVSRSNEELNVKLIPNYGTLEIDPGLSRGFGDVSELTVVIDGKTAKVGLNKLSPGKHRVEISHQCYETTEFEVSIRKGSELTFDKSLVLANGGLDLSAKRYGQPVEEYFYVNGKRWGETPYVGSVPACGEITIGSNKDHVPVTVYPHRDVSYTYEWQSENNSYGEDDYSYQNENYAKETKPEVEYPYGIMFQARLGFYLGMGPVSDWMRNEYDPDLQDIDDDYSEVFLWASAAVSGTMRLYLKRLAIGVGAGYYFHSASDWCIAPTPDDDYSYYGYDDDDELTDKLVGIRNYAAPLFLGELGFRTKGTNNMVEFGGRGTFIMDEEWHHVLAGLYLKFDDFFDFEFGGYYGKTFATGAYMAMNFSFPTFD